MRLLIIEAPGKLPAVREALCRHRDFSDIEVAATGGQLYDGPDDRLGIEAETLAESRVLRNPGPAEALASRCLEADEIIIMTDNDEVGEQIARDILLLIAPNRKHYSRIRIGNMGPSEITRALRRDAGAQIDDHLVASSDARRIFNRIVGFSTADRLSGQERAAPYGSAITPTIFEMMKKGCIAGEVHHAITHPDFALPLRASLQIKRFSDRDVALLNDTLEGIGKRAMTIPVSVEDSRERIKGFDGFTATLAVMKALGCGIEKAESLLQDRYMQGAISYCRTSSNRMTEDLEAMTDTARRKYSALGRVELDSSDVDLMDEEVKASRLSEPHPAIHPVSDEGNIADNLAGMTEEAIVSAIVARRFMLSDRTFSNKTFRLAVPVCAEEQERLRRSGVIPVSALIYSVSLYSLPGVQAASVFDESICPWEMVSKGGYRGHCRQNPLEVDRYTPEQVAFRVMAENGIGKPSTRGYLAARAGSFFDAALYPNGLAKKGYLMAKETLPALLDVKKATPLEAALTGSGSVSERVRKGLSLFGLSLGRIDGLEPPRTLHGKRPGEDFPENQKGNGESPSP